MRFYSMNRFFVDKNNIMEDTILINGEDVNHIKNVLRLKVEDEINICDGDSNEYRVTINNIEKNIVECKILERKISNTEPPLKIKLYQGLPKSTKMDLIIQKATEIGVSQIIPIITDRTVVKIEDRKKESKKLERWNRIAEEAAKQSRRGVIPQVKEVLSFKELLKVLHHDDAVLVPYENEKKQGLKKVLSNIKSKNISIIIGPEGGFSEWEINELEKINSIVVSLGPRILRTETAGFTAMTIILYELGDLGVI